jgi:oligopeptide/dipeptide ABC transporter ATP-binding protein
MSIILVTHNLGIVSRTGRQGSRHVCRTHGRNASVKDLISEPKHPYAKALISAVPVLGRENERLATIPGSVPSPANFPAGCRFFGRCALCMSLDAEKQRKCALEVPPLKEAGQRHFCACHWVG